ncbi:MAG: triose-phosphate isomerase [Pseudomonadota bacterium]
MAPTPLVAGNWKMNGHAAAIAELDALMGGLDAPKAEVLLCPPATLIADFAARSGGGRVKIGAQDCHPAPSGAHTGDLSAEMLADAGARAVIVGHSERRADHGEDSALVRAKAEAAHRAGLMAIVCIGETEAERDTGRAVAVCLEQLGASLPEAARAGDTAVAYEPVWAIGTGRTPTLTEIAEMHQALRTALAERFGTEGTQMRLLYGGSVKPANAGEIFALEAVDGGLVGGASLKAEDFLAIVNAAG